MVNVGRDPYLATSHDPYPKTSHNPYLETSHDPYLILVIILTWSLETSHDPYLETIHDPYLETSMGYRNGSMVHVGHDRLQDVQLYIVQDKDRVPTWVLLNIHL